MSDENDSWLSGIGIDVKGILGTVQEKGTALVDEVKSKGATAFEEAKGAVSTAAAAVTGVAPPPKPAAAPAPKPTAPTGAPSANGSSVSSLKGSVGAGGKNNPDDVKAVQAALKIDADGKCGPATIAAIQAFQKSIGQAKPDGRVDAGGATSRALAGRGGGGAAPPTPAPAPNVTPPSPFPDVEEDDGFLGGLKNKIVGAVEDTAGAAKDLGGRFIDGVTDLGGQVADGAKGLGSKFDGAGLPGPTTNSFPSFLKPDSFGGEVTFAEKSLGKKELGKYFELEAKVGGSIKFSGAPAGPDKPSKIEIEKGVVEFVGSMFAEAFANAKFEKGSGIKYNPKDKQVGLGGAVALKTNLGPLTIEFVTIEVSLANIDPKKGLTGPKLAASTSRSLGGKGTVRGVELELAVAVALGAELTPNYTGIAADAAKNLLEGGASEAIMVSIEAALLAGPPLLAGAVIAVGIHRAGEKGALEAAILEGAVDARSAALVYASAMVGAESSAPGPRAQAALAAAKKELAQVASRNQMSLEALMAEIRKSAPENKVHPDFSRFHAQARQQAFAAYFAEIRKVIKAWRKEHNVIAIFTTEVDDINSAEKKVAIIFEKP